MSAPTLPQHNDDKVGVTNGEPFRLKTYAITWFKETWLDILTMLALAGAALGIYSAPVAATRTFPITFSASGDIVYPSMGYPHRGWILPSWLSGFLSIAIPLVAIILTQIRIRSFADMTNAVIGVLYAVILSTLFQVVIKVLVGGLRPYFLDVCQPDIGLAEARNSSGLNGVGYGQMYYTADICTQEDKELLKTAMTSFPSGHSAAAWAGFIYLFLYLNAKLKVWADYRPAVWKIPIIFAPVLGAVLISCSLSIDEAHNWYDIVAGAVLGTTMAVACYRMGYAAVWDWRFNHVALRRGESAAFGREGTGMGMMGERERWKGVVTRRVGWGQPGGNGFGGGYAPGMKERNAWVGGRESGESALEAVRFPDGVVANGNGR